VLTKKSAADHDADWTTPSGSGGGGGYDDWSSIRAILNGLAAQLALSRAGSVDGWIDSLIDASGVDVANSEAAIAGGGASGQTGGIATPVMTSNTAPSGVASASQEYAGAYLAWLAFNRTAANSGDCWAADAPVPGTPSTWRWLRYDFGAGNARVIAEYELSGQVGAGQLRSPKAWWIQGSNDASTWDDLDFREGITWSSETEVKTFTLTATGSYRYYRLLCKETHGSFVTVSRLNLRLPVYALTLTSQPATTPIDATEYLVCCAVSAGEDYTIEIDLGDGWVELEPTRVPVSAAVDQLVASYSGSGTSVRVRVVAALAGTWVYGWSVGWR
jgi:hypothetical protein